MSTQGIDVLELLRFLRTKKADPKYSRNLCNWAHKYRGDLRVYVRTGGRQPNQEFYPSATPEAWWDSWQAVIIGGAQEQRGAGWIPGSRLVRILVEGGREPYWANIFSGQDDVVEITTAFWEAYREHGKCALDPLHVTYHERWHTEGLYRTCQWCGLKQKGRDRVRVTCTPWVEWRTIA